MSGCSLIRPDASPILLLAIQKDWKNASKGPKWAYIYSPIFCYFASKINNMPKAYNEKRKLKRLKRE